MFYANIKPIIKKGVKFVKKNEEDNEKLMNSKRFVLKKKYICSTISSSFSKNNKILTKIN